MSTATIGRSVEKRPAYALYAIIYATMFLFGFTENIKGVAFPLIKHEFNVAYSSQGGLVSATWFGYVTFCLVATLFLQRFGLKKSMIAGYVLVCAGALATLVSPTFLVVSMTLLLVNTGFGFFEVGSNAMAAVVFTGRTALMMNLMHFFYGFGAIVGPKAAGILTESLHLSWRQVYGATLVPVIAVLTMVFLTKFASTGGEASQGSANKAGTSEREAPSALTLSGALKSHAMWVFAVTLGFMEVVEFGAANWGGLYLQDVYGLNPRTVGASFVSLFYVLFTLARLFGGWAIERTGYVKSLTFSVLSTMLLFVIGFGLGRNGIWVLPATGLFIGIMWPTLMAVAMKAFGRDAPMMTSAIITVSGAINGLLQLVIGYTNHLAGEAWGYRSCLLYAGVVLVMLYALSRRLNAGRKEG